MAARRGMGGLPAEALDGEQRLVDDQELYQSIRLYRELAAQIAPEETQRAMCELEKLRDSEGHIE